MDALKPSVGVLVKLGSLAVHIDEYLSENGHPYDKEAINTLLSDTELEEWIAEMSKMAMLPEKRNK